MRPTPTPRSAARRTALGLALGTALVVAPASAAHAQFGNLIKRATEAAAGAAAGRATGAAAEKAGVGSGSSGATVDSDQLEITPERLDAFLVGMRGPIEAARQRAAYADRRAAWDKAVAEHGTRKQAYEACSQRVSASAQPDMSPAVRARQERLTDRISSLADRTMKAQEAGNTALVKQLADSVEVLRHATAELMFPSLSRTCGPRPSDAGPERPADDAPAADGPAFRPTVPEGMTPRQFGTLRERVAAWLIAADRRYVYAPAERQALESRRAALAPLTPLFRGDHLVWGRYMHGLGKES